MQTKYNSIQLVLCKSKRFWWILLYVCMQGRCCGAVGEGVKEVDDWATIEEKASNHIGRL